MHVGTGLYDDLIGTRTKTGSGLAGMVWPCGNAFSVDDSQTWSHRLLGARRDVLRAVVGVRLKIARSTGAGTDVGGVIGVMVKVSVSD